MEPDDLALCIPFMGILMGVALVLLAMHLHHRRISTALWLVHAQCLAAIAKGESPLPAATLLQLAHSAGGVCGTAALRRSALILLFAGAAITLALWQTHEAWLCWWGLVPVAWGVGKLLACLLEMREQQRRARRRG